MSRLTPSPKWTEASVRNLHAEYGDAADARDAVGVVACFHPSSTLVTSTGRILCGRRELSEFFRQWASSAPPSKHECSDHHLVRGDGWILSTCRARVLRRDADALLLAASYYDVLVLHGDRWLIGSRVVSPSGPTSFSNGSPAVQADS